MAQDVSTFHTHRNHILQYYPEEPIIFPYIRQFHSTPSLLINPDTDFYQESHSNSPTPDDDNSLESFQSHTSINPVASSKSNSHLPPTYQNFPSSPLPHDQSDDSFNSTDTDFEMLQNPIYHSTSFPRTFPRVGC